MPLHRRNGSGRVLRAFLVTLGTGLAPLAGAGLAAQVVRGTVTERRTLTALEGVLLSVIDARDTVVAQLLSGEAGAFEIRLPGAGTYAIEAKRIGIKRVRLAPFTVGDGETKRVEIALEPLPAVLSSVRVTGRTSCVRNPQTNEKTAALWEDARAALTAAVITRGLTSESDSVVRFERKLDVATWRVLYETRRKVPAATDRPFKSLPAEVLSVGGYVSVNQDGSTDYFAPDAEVLLSDTFLADHCFKIEEGTFEHTGLVGLGFQPVPERKKPDIKGVLWLDQKSAELRTLEFSYTWVPNDLRPVDFGGTVSFYRLPTGRWIVRSWRIRMPEFGNTRYVGSVPVRSPTPVLARISEEGGAVPLRTLLNQTGHIHGIVVLDTISNRPIAGITVALEGTEDSTQTASDGTFDLSLVSPGSYTVVLRHPALDSLGIVHLAQTVEVDAGRTAPLSLRFPSNDELAARMCNARVDFERQAVLRFIILDQSGKRMANTPAVFSRVPIGTDGKPVVDSIASYDVNLDAGGGFLACAIRADEIVRIESVPDTPVPWGETVRPRAGMIGWHVIRAPKKR